MLEQVDTTLAKLPSLIAMHNTRGDSSTALTKVVVESADWEQVVSSAGKASSEAELEAAAPEASTTNPTRVNEESIVCTEAQRAAMCVHQGANY